MENIRMYNGTFEKDENSQFSIWRIASLLLFQKIYAFIA